jgi:hypothetical protein
MVELDHVFICVSSDAPEASALTQFGLSEGQPNVHPGQGTACRRFFFSNGYIELLWVDNAAEAQTETVRPTCLWERWEGRTSGSCPFGFVFRPAAHQAASSPFPSWHYRPPYLPNTLDIQVGTNADVPGEPMLAYLSFANRPDARQGAERQNMDHAVGLREISRIQMLGPIGQTLSPALTTAAKAGLIPTGFASEYLLEIGFDGELSRRAKDFRPALPLIFRW